jgi:CheY-like chemotaxis protein
MKPFSMLKIMLMALFVALMMSISVAQSDTCHVADACHSECIIQHNCLLQQDSRDCTRRIAFIEMADPACEASKLAQNNAYAVQRASCEASKVNAESQCQIERVLCSSVANACSAVRRRGVNLKGKVILWVDDHSDNNIYQRDAFIELGATILLAKNTSEALDKLKVQRVDVIISDFARSDDAQAGYTLLAAIRRRPNPPPLIIFSSSSNPEYVSEARRRRAFGETNNNRELFDLVARAIRTQ